MLRSPALAVLVVAVLGGCGDDESGSREGNGVDRAFAAAMVPHHESAIEMAALAERRARARAVRQIAGAIEHLQEEEIVVLRRARPFGRAFLEMMIPHHEGAIAMARAELARGSDPELRDLAQRIVDGQQREIRFMRRALAGDAGGSGGAAVPDGGQAAGHHGG